MGLSEPQRALCIAATAGGSPKILYGGAGFGGKSYGLRACSVYTLLYLAGLGLGPNRAILATSTYGLLRDRHIGKLEEEYGQFGQVKESKVHGLGFHFHDPKVGVIALRNLDNPGKYRGTEAVGAFIDELTELPELLQGQDTLATLLYPIRASKSLPFLPFVAGSNPDGVGHAWVKGTWIDRTRNQGYEDLQVIRALPTDNPTLTANYLKTLEALPPHLRRARLEGSWESPEGARWGYLDRSVQIYSHAEVFPKGIPSSWYRFMGVDWGFRAPYAALWFAVDPSSSRIYLYREDYQAGLLSHEQAQRIKEKTGEEERIDRVRFDPSMWAIPSVHDVGRHSLAPIDQFRTVLGEDPRFGGLFRGYNKSRVHGFSTLDKVLCRGNGYPDLFISDECPNIWSELTGAVWDSRGMLSGSREDIDPRNADHAITAAYYALHAHLYPDEERPDNKTFTAEELQVAQLQEFYDRRARGSDRHHDLI